MKKSLLIILILLTAISGYAQHTITGTVTDEAGQVLPGVSVSVKNTKNATMTNMEGKYSLNVKQNDSILIFSYIGMFTQEINIFGKNIVDIKMIEEEVIDEVVVVTKLEVGVLSGDYSKRSLKKDKGYISPIMSGDDEPIENSEEYNSITDNGYKNVLSDPLSTLSIDVDNAAYSNVRRYIDNGTLPPADAVRIEEMINYFDYDYPNPTGEHPFAFVTEMSECPWNKDHKLMHIGIQGKKLDYQDLKPSNLVFLLDVSGSMSDANKLPLLKESFKLLVNELGQSDYVSIVVYAGAAGIILEPTPAYEKDKIFASLDKLQAGGSTAGGQGIELAYKLAKEHLIKDGNNRVILATDGDFNVGVSSQNDLVKLIEEKRKDDIYLTILGFGMGNYKDGTMEQISNAGNGNYFYIDNMKEAEKVFVKEMRANMFTIAKDVKIQIEFNPAKVQAYRLIGYENRLLNKEDFNDDTKDAGELGAGHTVTAIYEIVPLGVENPATKVDPLKYQNTTPKNAGSEVMTLKFRYKPLKSNESLLIETVVKDETLPLAKTSDNFRFSASVAAFGMLLRDSEYKGTATFDLAKSLAEGSKGKDPEGYRADYIKLIDQASKLKK